ncbi:MAG: cell wall metabolism sensor histidine kinase WalK [Alkalibacterium gilvum]|uniref:cell wall metabolism sensor histidine kinase WalK n=1 Tax=Alkalibacterium TaxID=99906 RepID=UPI0026473DAA|nr:cell wall metabolism sensor histidine kinase WalK [Alkalibacterium sp.]MDN6293181.1 cell wall metabolism sensor histidine kinase WalK [Alkalibacterium sp.]MDN6294822.1 cell wall metabolism sensor histidine kinase WalK [Alkalibacterium sp.]MDN6397477.1 cell wall metabolism sensor histidine kinase WalK [Alkalibacterium sp.]
MKKKIRIYQSINTKIVLVIVLLLVFVLQLIGANFITQIENQLITSFQEDRKVQMDFLESTITSSLEIEESGEGSETSPEQEISSLLTEFSGSGITDLQVVNSELIVMGTSDTTQQSTVGQLSDDVDLRQAQITENSITRQVIDSITQNRRWKIVEPVFSSGEDSQFLGAILMESNIESVYDQISQITWIFLQSSAVAIILSLVLANMLSRALTKPIKEMQLQTREIAEGDYSGTLKVYGEDELGQLASLINDLSDDVAEAQESIDAERRRLDSVLTHMTDGVLATDRRGKIIIINEMAQSMLDIDQETATEKNLLSILDVEDDITLRSILEKQDDILVNSRQNDIPIILRASFSLIQRESGFISGLVCVLHDVTEQERIEEERKQFVSNVSHELRTPLTSMRSYIEALADGAWQDPDLAPRFLEVTQNETDRMIRMIQDLLQLSRIDSGKSMLNLEIVDLTEMLDHVLNRFDMMIHSAEYEDKKYQINKEILEQSIFVEVDPDRMIQVLDNIMNNAIKYSPDGGTISGKMEKREDTVLISVRDEGMGIPKADINKIFSRFYRVDRARSRAMGGSGLGLAISKEVVEQHGGHIWADSTEGKGTTFYLSLPYFPYEEEEWE